MKVTEIKYNQAIDLSCALLQYARWDEIVSVNVPGYSVSPELEQWHTQAAGEIPGLLDNDIRYLLGNFLGLLFLPVEAVLNLKLDSIPELIDYLETVSAEELPQKLYETYNSDIPFDEIKNRPELLKKAIENAGGTTVDDEARMFADFIRDPDDFRKRLVDIMKRFYELAIRPREEFYMSLANGQIEKDQRVFDADPQGFFSGYCRININTGEDLPELYMSFFSEIDIIQIDNPAAVIYGRCRSLLENTSELPVEQIYSLFNDDSRRRILQLLCRKSWFIRELADELGITSATISYHMGRLASMNLVTYERGERKRVYYRADIKKVREIIRAVERDILGALSAV